MSKFLDLIRLFIFGAVMGLLMLIAYASPVLILVGIVAIAKCSQ